MRAALAASVAAFMLLAMPIMETTAAKAQSEHAEPGSIATAAVVREIQFMLLTIGIDPGPIDGNPRQMTNRAVRIFQQRSGLPQTDLVSNEPVPPALLERLRQAAAKVMLKPESPSAPPARRRKRSRRSRRLRLYHLTGLLPAPTAPMISELGGGNIRRNRSLTRVSTAPQIGR